MLADVGLLGFPNAGKSTLVRSVSAAEPKVADYPFTTLHPSLGVVSPAPYRSFVMADIPGLIEGAADGAGLGVRFLKHLSRTRLLLHIVDIAPYEEESDPAKAVLDIENELKKFSEKLFKLPRWLVFNKCDLLPEIEASERCQNVVRQLNWKGPVFQISGMSKVGTQQLCYDIMEYLEREAEENSNT